jgi:hypothetical protein
MTPEAEAAYDALPRPLRLAAISVLVEARKKTAHHWPGMPMIIKHAGIFEVDVDQLAGVFGFRVSRIRDSICWVDTVRSGPASDYEMIELFGVIPTNDGYAFHELSFGERFYPRVEPRED